MTNENFEPQEIKERGSGFNPGSLGFAIVLILLGVFFLARQLGGFRFENWWALFILIPAFSAFGTALGIWQRSGRFNFAVWSTFYGGLFPLLVAFMFLFDLDWGDYWPLFVILPGVGMMISGLPFQRESDRSMHPALVCHRSWVLGIGLSATLVGISFLGMNLGWFEPSTLINVENWWGIFILIPALGGFATMLCLLITGNSTILALVNLAIAGLVAFSGIVAMYALDWRLINIAGPLILILAGIGLIFGFGLSKDEDSSS